MRNLSSYPKRDAGRYKRNTNRAELFTQENILMGVGFASAIGLAGVSAKYFPIKTLFKRHINKPAEVAINPS